MALASAAAANAALDAVGTLATHMSLHTATTSTTGAAENPETGSYARKAVTWNAAAASAMTNVTSLSFDTAGTTAVTHIGTWTSGTYGAGSFLIGAALAAPITAAVITIAPGAVSLGAA